MRASVRLNHGFAGVSAALLLGVSVASAQVGVGRLAGSVKDDRGRPIKGATVVAENKNVSAEGFSTATDEKGRFALLGLRAGTWTIRIEAPGYYVVAREMPIATIRANPPLDARLVRKLDPGPPPILGNADPKRLQGALDEAAALVTAGQFDAAIAAYQRLLAAHPALTSINLQLGYLYETKGDQEAARAAYRAAQKP
jgi:hypothetical protein